LTDGDGDGRRAKAHMRARISILGDRRIEDAFMQQQACQAALLTYQELDAGREGRGGEGGRTEARRLARYPYGPQHAEADELVLNVALAYRGREVAYACGKHNMLD